MHDKQQMPSLIHSDDCVARLIVCACVDYAEKRIEECLRRLLKSDSVFPQILLSFGLTPDKGNSIQLELLIHKAIIGGVMTLSIHPKCILEA